MMLYVQRLCTLAVIIIANGEKKRRNYSWRLNNIHLSIGTISNEKCAKELWIDVTKCHLFPCGIQHRNAFTPLFVPLFCHEPQCLSHTNDNLLFRQPCRRSIQAEIFCRYFINFFSTMHLVDSSFQTEHHFGTQLSIFITLWMENLTMRSRKILFFNAISCVSIEPERRC